MQIVVSITLKNKKVQNIPFFSHYARQAIDNSDGPLQIRKRADGDRVLQREQHVGEHDRPAFGSLLARSCFTRRFTDQHTRIRRGNARLSICWFVCSSVSFDVQTSGFCAIESRNRTHPPVTLLPFFFISLSLSFFPECATVSLPLTIDCS